MQLLKLHDSSLVIVAMGAVRWTGHISESVELFDPDPLIVPDGI